MNLISDLIANIKLRRAEIAEALAQGHAHTIESYNRMVGTCQGLQESLQMIEELLRQEDEDQDL